MVERNTIKIAEQIKIAVPTAINIPMIKEAVTFPPIVFC